VLLLRLLLMPKLMLCASVVAPVLPLALRGVPLPLLPIPIQALSLLLLLLLPVLLLLLLAGVPCFFFSSPSSSPMLREAVEEGAERKARRLLGLPSCRRWKMLGVIRGGGSCCGLEGSKGAGLLALPPPPPPLSESCEGGQWVRLV